MQVTRCYLLGSKRRDQLGSLHIVRSSHYLACWSACFPPIYHLQSSAKRTDF
jgi:hypothetical protein